MDKSLVSDEKSALNISRPLIILCSIPRVFILKTIRGVRFMLFICLSTMESTLCVLEILEGKKFNGFLKPFEKMVEYQVACSIDVEGSNVRYKIPYKS